MERCFEQFVLTSAVFLAFLLAFEAQIVVPNWLQVVGRLHPLVLHFPIVLLLILVTYEFFKFTQSQTPWTEIVEKWVRDAWIAGLP